MRTIRVLTKLPGVNDAQREALASARSELGAIYNALRAYSAGGTHCSRDQAIEARFDKLCATRTCYNLHQVASNARFLILP